MDGESGKIAYNYNSAWNGFSEYTYMHRMERLIKGD